jgi:hypothetical protein
MFVAAKADKHWTSCVQAGVWSLLTEQASAGHHEVQMYVCSRQSRMQLETEVAAMNVCNMSYLQIALDRL